MHVVYLYTWFYTAHTDLRGLMVQVLIINSLIAEWFKEFRFLLFKYYVIC